MVSSNCRIVLVNFGPNGRYGALAGIFSDGVGGVSSDEIESDGTDDDDDDDDR